VSEDDSVFEDGDPFDLPEWREVELMVGALPRPANGYVTCPLAWLARVRPLVRSVEQLVVLQLLYRQCLMLRSRTVPLPNGELAKLGISRFGKYRALARLAEAGLITVATRNGRAVYATLHQFP
jgi:hypothetical protein